MNYNDFLNELYSLKDLKYKEFNSKIVCADNIIGVRTPELKKIAKTIAKGDYISFFKENKHKYYEETLVHGLVLGYLSLDFVELKYYIDDFLPYINNWAICDMTVSNLKIFSKTKCKDVLFKEIKKYIKDNNPWINRFGYVLLLDYFIEDKYIDEIFELCKNYKDHYYVKMGIAWLISVCFIKQKEKTLKFLESNKLDDWTYNKAIQKIIESNRVVDIDKKMLRGMKRK